MSANESGATWNSNTPFPKLYNDKCPATIAGNDCVGDKCRVKRKGCVYTIFRRNVVSGRAAIRALKREGFEVV